MTRLLTFALAVVLSVTFSAAQTTSPAPPTSPLNIARILAARYPESPIMSYIPAVAWSSSLRLAQLTGEEKWKDKPRRDIAAFLSGGKPAIAAPYALTSLAGHFAFVDLAAADGNKEAAAFARKAADFILDDAADGTVKFRRNWTDDMFMSSTLLSRVTRDTQDERYSRALGQLLTTYAEKLQRQDGIFMHAIEGPHAWGRGNGFALLGLAEALTHLPGAWPDRPRVLAIYRKHVNALVPLQSDDGAWRQVVDEPTSYRELTVTAMTTAAMARGLRLGWLDPSVRPVVDRGWAAVAARVNPDGTVRDVCSGTGAQATRDYYMTRPVVNGPDDRGGAMALLAAIEIAELTR
jgi:unsaturated rhamnogalacturonyl hydrolase